MRTAGATLGVVIEPHEFPVYGVRSVSPMTTRTPASEAPNDSAATWVRIVREPVPRSCVPVRTSALPSELSLARAYAGGPPPVPQTWAATPTPRRVRRLPDS